MSPFLDTDAEMEREAGKPIRRIFAEDGEPAFRALETALLQRLAPSCSPRIGGEGGDLLSSPPAAGRPCATRTSRLLRQIGPVVWLTAPPATILQRVGPDLSLRPLLAAFQDDPLARIESLLAARAPHYAAVADLTCDTSLCCDAGRRRRRSSPTNYADPPQNRAACRPERRDAFQERQGRPPCPPDAEP